MLQGWGVIMAYWTVDFDEMECKTVWGRTWDKVSILSTFLSVFLFIDMPLHTGMHQARCPCKLSHFTFFRSFST